MVYSRCYYFVFIRADEFARKAAGVARGRVRKCVRHVCHWHLSEIVKVVVGDGCGLLLVDLTVEVPIVEFISRLKRWTSAWILEGSQADEPDFWTEEGLYYPLSPEDRDAALRVAERLEQVGGIEEFVERWGMYDYRADIDGDNGMAVEPICHHIILISSRSRLLLRVKYRLLLGELAMESVRSIGLQPVQCSSMCNHVHVLCHIPPNVSVESVINRLKDDLLERMHANIHFRRYDGWDDDSVTYAVSRKHVADEEYIVLTQDVAHQRCQVCNEMSYLYRRLKITYVTSLN